jgi:5'-phosphate synthase pdxT subunit
MAIPRVGVLALQGDFARHRVALEALGVEVRCVTRPGDLDGLVALVMPGGESTTMLRVMAANALRGELEAFVREQPVLGTCAGLILLAREVDGTLPEPPFAALDVSVERNAYGRQIDSFSESIDIPALGGGFRGVFIRAPRIRRVGAGVEVIARRGFAGTPGGGGSGPGEPVGVRAGRAVGLCFHPELSDDLRLHRWFLGQVAGVALSGADAAPPALASDAAGRVA